REELSQATVQLRVLDANTFLRNSLIGSYQFDLLGIYLEKDHEFYRTWVGVQDTESAKEAGVQGFIKLSITVLGPGDRQKVHNLVEEMQVGQSVQDLQGDKGAPLSQAEMGTLGGLVLTGPAVIPQELNYLVIYVFAAEDLPGHSSLGAPSVNALVQV
ncbi:unnamed protein product, partial [Discosporangium mesarthrocarpum]